MLKPAALLIILILSNWAKAQQNCSCESAFSFLTSYTEKNLPAYKILNKNRSQISEYTLHKESIQNKVFSSSTSIECFKLLNQYISFFHDNHTSIRMPYKAPIDEKNSRSVKAFKESTYYQNKEIITLSEDQLKQKGIESICGIYSTADSAYTVAVIPSSQNQRDFVGVILSSTSQLWEPGQIKFELTQKDQNVFSGLFYSRNHSVLIANSIRYNDGVLANLFYKTNRTNRQTSPKAPDHIVNMQLNDSTYYLRIPTFDGNAYHILDSVYTSIHDSIIQSSHLIIDVRDNGGGSDNCVIPLVDYFYTDTIVNQEKVYYYATEDIIKIYKGWYKAMKKDTLNYSPLFAEEFKSGIDKMEEAEEGSFVLMSEDNDTLIRQEISTIKKVAILYNQGCASSCETLLMLAQKSDKAILIGENSGGYTGYGNVSSVSIPCFNFKLAMTTTLYSESVQYEKEGIAPQFYLDQRSNWVDQTIDILRVD